MAQDPERPVRPGNSLPANPATRLRTRPRSEDTAALATPRATWAAYQEGRVALVFAAGTCALVVALLLLTLVNPGEEDIALAPGKVDPWTGSLLTLVLLLVALQLVSVLLALEHRVGKPAPKGERTPLPGVPVGMVVIWGMRSLVTLAVVLAVYVAWGGEFWSVTWAVPPVAELVAFGLLVWAWRTQRQPPPLEPIAPSGFADDAPAPDEGTPERPSTRLFAIGASGGGIRAAAFVLGGHQAVQESSAELDCATAANEPHVFAVSGGSYIGAALALRRRYDLTRPIAGRRRPGRRLADGVHDGLAGGRAAAPAHAVPLRADLAHARRDRLAGDGRRGQPVHRGGGAADGDLAEHPDRGDARLRAGGDQPPRQGGRPRPHPWLGPA